MISNELMGKTHLIKLCGFTKKSVPFIVKPKFKSKVQSLKFQRFGLWLTIKSKVATTTHPPNNSIFNCKAVFSIEIEY